MPNYRKAFQLVLKDPYTALQTRETYHERSIWGLFGNDFEEERWRVSGPDLYNLLSILDLVPPMENRDYDRSHHIDIIKIPSSYKGLYEGINHDINICPEEIWVKVHGPNHIDIMLVYEQKPEDQWSSEYTYCGGFAVEWYQEFEKEEEKEDEQLTTDIPPSL